MSTNNHPIVKGLVITTDKVVTDRDFASLKDFQKVVEGYIEPVTLRDGSTMYVNEEFLYANVAFNSIASDVCGLGGLPHLMLSGIKGNVVIVGPVDNEGWDTDVTEQARRWVRRVAREA